MRTKWFIIALILIVLPTTLLSILAARAIGHYELILQAELQQDASRVLTTIDSAVRDQTVHMLERLRITLGKSLGSNAGTEKLTRIAQKLARENPAVSEVLVFMNPWGFLATSCHDETDPDISIAHDLLANELRLRLANKASSRRRIPRTPDTPQSPASPGLRAGDTMAPLAFVQNGIVYYFAPMPGTASVWAGLAIDRKTLDDLLTDALNAHPAAGMVLSFTTDALRDPSERGGVVVSDSLSPTTQAETPAGSRGDPELPILASTFLMPPLDQIELLAQAAPGVEIQRIARARTRLYGWGLVVVIAWILLGIGVVLRQTIVEIHQARQRGEFLLGVSHDLRTPLASMRMLAESLAHGHVRKQEQPRFMNTIVSECDRLSRLIERVLYLVRYGQGALVCTQRDIDLGDVVQNSVAELKTYAHSLQVRIAPNLPRIQGDRTALAQVVLNLLDNAIKYGKREEEIGDQRPEANASDHPTSDLRSPTTEHPVRVELAIDTVTRRRHRWSQPAPWICLSVRDFGMGIAKHEQRRIFHRFYRSSRAHDRNVSGVGLGLALCRHVIRSHGGWIEVESEVGEGTTFRVYLKSG